jgi:hypothetical protein
MVMVEWQSAESLSQKIKEYGNLRSERGHITCGGKSPILELYLAFRKQQKTYEGYDI